MGLGYVRADTSDNIASGKVIDAADFDAEFDAIESAFGTSGHTHDGTSAEGGPIEVTGPAQEYLYDGIAIYPKTDDTYDIGKTGAEFRNLYIDGTAFLDAVDIDGGTIDGVSIGGNSASAGKFTTLEATGIATIDLSQVVSAGPLSVADGGTGGATATAARANLGVVIGTDVQAASTHLTAIANLAKTDGNFIVANGTTYVAESGATARTSLGLGSMSTQNSGTVNISGGTIVGITDLAIADGGTGASTASGARVNLGLVVGTNVQAWYSVLDTIGTNGGVDTTELIDDAVTYAKIDNAILTGADLQLVTGTAGVSGNLARWNADGDLVGSIYSVIDDDSMATASSTTIPTSESVKAYADTNPNGLASGQTWQDVSGSRSAATSYQNTTGKPIFVYIRASSGGGAAQVSPDNSTWIEVGDIGSGSNLTASFVVPNTWYYRTNGGTPFITDWSELR